MREGATAQYNELKAEDERIDKKLKGMIRPSGRNTVNFFDGDNDGCMSSTVNIATGNGGYNTQGNVNQYRPTQNSENYGDRNGNQHELHRHQYGNAQDNGNYTDDSNQFGVESRHADPFERRDTNLYHGE